MKMSTWIDAVHEHAEVPPLAQAIAGYLALAGDEITEKYSPNAVMYAYEELIGAGVPPPGG